MCPAVVFERATMCVYMPARGAKKQCGHPSQVQLHPSQRYSSRQPLPLRMPFCSGTTQECSTSQPRTTACTPCVSCGKKVPMRTSSAAHTSRCIQRQSHPSSRVQNATNDLHTTLKLQLLQQPAKCPWSCQLLCQPGTVRPAW